MASPPDFPNHIPTRTVPPFVRSVDASFPHEEVQPPPYALPVSRWVTYMQAAGAPRRPLTQIEVAQADSIWQTYDEKSAQRATEDESLLASGWKSKERRKELRHGLVRRSKRSLLRNPFAPLFFRIWIVLDSVIALVIASDIVRYSRPCRNKPTHVLAVIIHTIAIPYTLYIAWDEFFSKPLGLRRSRSKLRLLVLDLFFIIFESANLSLALNVGTNTPKNVLSSQCAEQWGLIVVIFIALFSWVATFLLSLFRLMYKMEGLQ